VSRQSVTSRGSIQQLSLSLSLASRSGCPRNAGFVICNHVALKRHVMSCSVTFVSVLFAMLGSMYASPLFMAGQL